jgi:diguanylate cyclase (GGDEF)-like protein
MRSESVDLHSTQEIWSTLKHLPFAVLLHDTQSQTFQANTQTQTLFDLNTNSQLTENDFNHLTLINPLSKIIFSIKSLFNDYLLPHTSNQILIEKQGNTFLLNVRLAHFNESLSMLVFELIKNNVNEEYNFDKVISSISTDLIDIQIDDIDKHIDYALKAIGTVANADRSYLFRFNKNNTKMSNTHEWVNEGILPFKDTLQDVPKSALPYFFSLMNDTYLFRVNDTSTLPKAALSEKIEFEQQEIKSVLCIGLRYEKELVGFIGCDSVKELREWTDLDLIRLKLVGEILTNAFKNIDYRKKLELAQQQLITANKKLNELANTDGLTNIANRRSFDRALKNEIRRCVRNQHPIALIICDIDFFKHFNDSYGHQQGDEALKLVASTLNKLCNRQGDLAARYGGEEFVIILPATDAKQCKAFTALIQKEIETLNIEHHYSNIAKRLTVSMGFYALIPNTKTLPEDLISNADSALYNAKKTGRNKASEFISE